jgi:membrane-associated phospholipid phosphatase
MTTAHPTASSSAQPARPGRSRTRWPGWRAPLLAGALALSPALTRADAVLDWNVTALRTTAAAPFNPPLEARNLAIVQVAVFDAVNAIAGEFQPYLDRASAPSGASPDAAASAAAHLTLVRLYPPQQAALDAVYEAALARIPSGRSREDGIAVGLAAAEGILAARAADGAAEAVAARYVPRGGPGAWAPTPPAFLPALDPGWGSVAPFTLRKVSRYRPGPPPALESARHARDLEEVRRLGSAASTARTAAQTDLARFWIATGPQNWNPVARAVAAARGLTLSQSARLLALLNLAGADAFIACWDAKFAYGQWRPVTAIRAADTDGNPATAADPAWTPLLVTPPFPDYPAGHTTFAGAAAAVLGAVVGDPPGIPLALTSPTAPGVVETYATFDGIAEGVVEARVLGGIHWRTSSAVGKQLGERIGRHAVRRFLGPSGECDHAAGEEPEGDED